MPPNVGTQDVGCAPVPPGRCDFSLANASRVMGGATTGFLRRDTGAPAGYLGDGVTPHAITGGTAGNDFAVLDSNGNDLGLSTDQFTVAGQLAGSLDADPRPVDFGGQAVSTTSATKTVTITNLDKNAVTVSAAAISGTDAASFAVAPGADLCAGRTLTRDQTCTVGVRLTPPATAGVRTASLDLAYTNGVHSPAAHRADRHRHQRGLRAGADQDHPVGRLRLGPGVRTTSPQQIVTITNSGNAPLGITTVRNTGDAPLLVGAPTLSSTGAAAYSVTANTCGSVAPGASCTISVRTHRPHWAPRPRAWSSRTTRPAAAPRCR